MYVRFSNVVTYIHTIIYAPREREREEISHAYVQRVNTSNNQI